MSMQRRYYRLMDVRDEFNHLSSQLEKHPLAADPNVDLVRVRYGPDKQPWQPHTFRALVVLSRHSLDTREALRESLPKNVSLELSDGTRVELPVEIIDQLEYEERRSVPPGARGAVSIDDLPIEPLD